MKRGAAGQNGWALRDASAALKDDREIVLESSSGRACATISLGMLQDDH